VLRGCLEAIIEREFLSNREETTFEHVRATLDFALVPADR
jgi:hypothetical protein